MAAVTQGIAHIYGIQGDITGVTVNSFRYTETPVNTAEVEGKTGNIVERRYDDLTTEAVVEVTLRVGYDIPSAKGTLFSYDGLDYEIQSIERAEEKKGYNMLTLNLKRSEEITPA